jgi:predicted metal-dependent phosphoesterase TrpH
MKTVWSKADIHVHTTYSDGHADVDEVLEHAAQYTDLRVIAITDHDTIEGALEARRARRTTRWHTRSSTRPASAP